jgi:N-acetylglucosamine kinase-like BadF-type ATPase
VTEYLLGIDGGNSKTDVVVATASGDILARTRGPGVRSPAADVTGWRDGLSRLVHRALAEAGVTRVASAAYLLANVDLPEEHDIARRELAAVTPAAVTVVDNDTLAVLRAGARRRWGVAVVAGAGINAVGADPDGRREGFLALGDFTGDAGGGHHLGVLALGAAIRAGDGRGPATALTTAVPAHFGLTTPERVAVAVHRGDIAHHELHVLAPVVFQVARSGDPVARGILSMFADEVATMAVALIRRLDLADLDVEVVLGGGVMRNAGAGLLDPVRAKVGAVAARAQVSRLDVRPVYGALVEALDQARAGQARDEDRAGLARLRSQLLA